MLTGDYGSFATDILANFNAQGQCQGQLPRPRTGSLRSRPRTWSTGLEDPPGQLTMSSRTPSLQFVLVACVQHIFPSFSHQLQIYVKQTSELVLLFSVCDLYMPKS